MGLWLKQSTAIDVIVGPFIDDTDGKTAETGLTITQADVRLSKNGGNMAQKNEATALTHDEIGYYDCNLDATDTNTLGRLQLMIHEAGALPVYHEYMVVTANTYDSFFGADTLQADLTQMGGVAQSATDLKDFADAGYDPATDKVNGVKLTDLATATTDVTNDVGITQAGADKVWGTAVRALTDKVGFALSAAGIDAILDEIVDANAPANANSLRETINVMAAALAGKLSGGGGVNRIFRDLGDTKNRLTVVVDANYNRTAATQDGT